MHVYIYIKRDNFYLNSAYLRIIILILYILFYNILKFIPMNVSIFQMGFGLTTDS